jgi:hypothetical protein
MHISKFFFACSPYLSWNSLFFAVYYQRVSLRYGLISCLRARRWASSHRRGWADGTGVRTAQHGQGRSGRCRSVRRPHLTATVRSRSGGHQPRIGRHHGLFVYRAGLVPPGCACTYVTLRPSRSRTGRMWCAVHRDCTIPWYIPELIHKSTFISCIFF